MTVHFLKNSKRRLQSRRNSWIGYYTLYFILEFTFIILMNLFVFGKHLTVIIWLKQFNMYIYIDTAVFTYQMALWCFLEYSAFLFGIPALTSNLKRYEYCIFFCTARRSYSQSVCVYRIRTISAPPSVGANGDRVKAPDISVIDHVLVMIQ